MIIGGTLITLALWIAFIWFFDPDGIAAHDKRYENTHQYDGVTMGAWLPLQADRCTMLLPRALGNRHRAIQVTYRA